jgi:hypothetical protein
VPFSVAAWTVTVSSLAVESVTVKVALVMPALPSATVTSSIEISGPSEARSNVAVTALSASIVSMQVPVPLQSPLQPANVESPAGVAVRVTDVPSS